MTETIKRRRSKKKQKGEVGSEKDVKAKIDERLEPYTPYVCNPATHGFGKSGHPDKLTSLFGRLVGIEAKYGKNDWSPYQEARLGEIQDSGGVPLLINERNVEAVSMYCRILEALYNGDIDMAGLPDKYIKLAGPVFARVRVNRGIELKEAAAAAGMHRQTLSRYEKGESPMPAAVLFALCEIYDADVGKILVVIKRRIAARDGSEEE